MKITQTRLKTIIKEELENIRSGGQTSFTEASDPVGPVEAQKVAELLQNLGFTLTRGGMSGLEDFLLSLEQSGDLNATPDSRRGAIAEGDEQSRTITAIEKIGDEVDRLAGMITDQAALERLEMIDDMVHTLLAQMQGVAPAPRQ